MILSQILCSLASLAGLASAIPTRNAFPKPSFPVPADSGGELPRLILYYQTTHDYIDRPISMLPLINQKNIALTHLIVCTFHVRSNRELYLNDFPPHHPRFWTMWNETEIMQRAGVRVFGMVGGASSGSFTNLTLDGDTGTFERAYGQLRDALIEYKLEGLDIDVEQRMSQYGISRLVRRLRKDFGPEFIITLSPVASALRGGGNLSGFDYRQLDKQDGDAIDFYMAQFYNGWGRMHDPLQYESIIEDMGYDPSRVVAGQVTTARNGGGFVPFEQLNKTISYLLTKFPRFGGIMGWEYFNSHPGGLEEPWVWAQQMTAILRPNLVPRLAITKSIADRLSRTWRASAAAGGGVRANMNCMLGVGGCGPVPERTPTVDYYSMVNTEE